MYFVLEILELTQKLTHSSRKLEVVRSARVRVACCVCCVLWRYCVLSVVVYCVCCVLSVVVCLLYLW